MSIMYHGVSKPLQQPRMTSVVYLQNGQPSPVTYYATEPVLNQRPIQQIQQHHAPLVYPITASPHCVPGAPQQAIIPEGYVSEGSPFYAYQPAQHEASSNAGNFVCLVPTVAVNDSAQLSMLLHSLGNNSCSLHADPALLAQDTHAASQVMQHMLTADRMQMVMEPHAPPPQSAIEGSAKATFPESSEVCRHYISGRCNRRKCRFLHPDLRSPVMSSPVTHAPCDVGSIINNQPVAHVSPLTPYSSLSTLSLNSLHTATPISWETRPR